VQDDVFGYSQSAGYEVAQALEPWQGYWIRVLVPTGVSLIFPATTAPTAAVAR